MHSIKSDARRAGLIYLLLAITGAFSLFYMSGAFIVPGDATATARNITAAPLMYRVGVLSGLASDVIFLWLALSLYDLLKDVDRKQARLMVILVTAGSAVALAGLINHGAAGAPERGRLPVAVQQTAAGRAGDGLSQTAQPGHVCGNGVLGVVALAVRPPRHQVRVLSQTPGRSADRRLRRLSGRERDVDRPAGVQPRGVPDRDAVFHDWRV